MTYEVGIHRANTNLLSICALLTVIIKFTNSAINWVVNLAVFLFVPM